MSTFGRVVCAYLRFRYGGNVAALKPPLGWSRRVPAPAWYKVWYTLFLYPRWLAETALFDRYGAPMRHAWLTEGRPLTAPHQRQ